MLDEYYEIVGWDERTGIPKRSTLESLGLKDVADDWVCRESMISDEFVNKQIHKGLGFKC